jgi:DNA-binding helix-hairpin-helix protein with protein kinase domain
MRVRVEGNGREIDLDGPPLARGGEATLHPLPGSYNLLAKVYHEPTDEHASRLAAMLAAPPDGTGTRPGHRAVAWPVGRLLAVDSDRVVGCLLPRVEGCFLIAEVFNPRARLRACPSFHSGSLLRVARNLATAVQGLHRHGCVVGDLNESNVLVAPDGLVTLVDADSFQVSAGGRVFRCRVGKPEYTPPELQGAEFAAVERGPEHDAFALAVLVFQLLMQGLHPFAGMYTGEGEPPPVPRRVAAGHWPYAWGRDGPFAPIPYAPPWAVLPPPVQELLTQCFEEGHETPSRRPDAATWRQALDEAEGMLQECSRRSRHRYPRGLDECPWCVLARQHDQDPFPAPGAVLVSRRALVGGVASADAEGPAPAPALDPDDPLPPAVVAPPRGADAGATAAKPAWLAWAAAGAAGALVGLLVTLWHFRAPAPPTVHPPVADVRPSAPARTQVLRPLLIPVRQPVPEARVERRPQPPASAPHPDPLSKAARAERAWRDALAELQVAQQEYKETVAAYGHLTQDYREGRATAKDLERRALEMRRQADRLREMERNVRSLARLWQEAQQAEGRDRPAP